MSSLWRFSVKCSLSLLLVFAVPLLPGKGETAGLTLSWKANSTEETGFKIERKTGSTGTFGEIAVVGASITSYVDFALVSGLTYCYRVRAYNSVGHSDYSNEACATTLFANKPPIANAGLDVTVNEGALVTLTGAGSTDPDGDPLAFSWIQVGGPAVLLNGSNTSSPNFTAPIAGYSGTLLTFQLTVTDTAGLSSTDSVAVRVNSSLTSMLTPKLVNLSNRSLAGTKDNVMITGFILEGTTPETILIRGLGPSLAEAGVRRVLSDPALRLFSGSELIAANDNWQETQAAEIAATGLDPCQPLTSGGPPPTGCNRESGIYITLQPGAYTAHLDAARGATGVGLADVFLLSNDGSELVNVSTRSVVGAGNDVIIAGFIIHGTEAKNVLIRGRGPSLADFGVSGTLANPNLSLFSGSQLIASNDNWQDTQSAEIISTGLDPCQPVSPSGPPPTGCHLESALYMTLEPGVYTAHLSGMTRGTGVGLVEVFILE